MPQGHLGVLADRGQGRSQLMGGVGDEAPLPELALLEAGQHEIQRLGEPGDLVVAQGVWQPAVQFPA